MNNVAKFHLEHHQRTPTFHQVPHPEGKIRVGQITHGTRSEGPGLRTAIWFQGCSIRCPGCCNPHLFTNKGGQLLTAEEILDQCPEGTEGITVMGGEPFDQAPELCRLAREAQARGLSVIVFTGYREFTLSIHSNVIGFLLRYIDVLVDGVYDRTQPDTTRQWVGSKNQQVHYYTDRYNPKTFEGVTPAGGPGATAERLVELHYKPGEGLQVVGWPTRHDLPR